MFAALWFASPMLAEAAGLGRAGIDKPARWETLFVILVLFVMCNTLDARYLAGGVDGVSHMGDSDPVRFGVLLAVYLVTIIQIVRNHTHQILPILGQNKLLLILLAYVTVSCLWAIDPSVAMRRALALELTAVFCLYLVMRFEPVEILRMAGWALTFVVVLSIAFMLLWPNAGSLDGSTLGPNAWHGLVATKTRFGRLMALGMLAVWTLRRTTWRLQPIDAVIFLLFAFCLYKSEAVTSWVACFAAFASIALMRGYRQKGMPMIARVVVLALIGIPLAVLVIANSDQILYLLGRNPTFTNRVFIWSAVYEVGLQRPLLGAGFGSFWVEGYTASALFNIFGSTATRLANAHNGFLEVWLQLGLVGVALTVALFVQMGARVLSYAGEMEDDVGVFFGALFVLTVVTSVSEANLFEHSEISWGLFITGLMTLKWHGTANALEPDTPLHSGNLDQGAAGRLQ